MVVQISPILSDLQRSQGSIVVARMGRGVGCILSRFTLLTVLKLVLYHHLIEARDKIVSGV
jgi:hypothetical protein